MKGISVFLFLILMSWAVCMCGTDCDTDSQAADSPIKQVDKYEKLKSYFVDEFDTILKAANRNDCTGDLFLILLSIRRAESGPKGLEFGVMHPKAKYTNLDTQAGWAAATVVKNYQRWLNAGKPNEFIVFLGNKYCPPDAHPLNRHWVKNVKHWYKTFKYSVS